MNGTLRAELKKHFPWLGTDESVDCSDAVSDLASLYAMLARPSAKIEDDHVVCPKCGSYDLVYTEDIGNARDVNEIRGGVLMIEGFYEIPSGFDDGEDGRLFCRDCGEECDIPDGLDVDFL